MKFINTSQLSKKQRKEILEIWNHEYPRQLNYSTLGDFDNYLKKLEDPSHIVVVDEKDRIKGWYVDFIREGEKWFVIILDSELHGKGLGTKLLNLAKAKEIQLNGWVIDHDNDKRKNGAPYNSPLAFYLKNGFERLPDVRMELEKISAVQIKWTKTP